MDWVGEKRRIYTTLKYLSMYCISNTIGVNISIYMKNLYTNEEKPELPETLVIPLKNTLYWTRARFKHYLSVFEAEAVGERGATVSNGDFWGKDGDSAGSSGISKSTSGKQYSVLSWQGTLMQKSYMGKKFSQPCGSAVPSGNRLLECCMSGSITVTTWTEEAEAMSNREVSLQNSTESQQR